MGAVVYKVRHFLVVLGVLIMSFYGCFLAYFYISEGAYDAKFYEIIQVVFNFSFGDFGPAGDDKWAPIWGIFVAMTIVITLVMMNLLISVVGEEFNFVVANMKDIEGQLLCDIIL
jgi:hypothetical protein